MIEQSQISKLSNRLFRENGGKRIPESVLERDYCIAWFLIGLARTPLRNKIIFKGGTALRRCYFSDYRFSEDLDFTLLDQSLTFDALKKELEQVYKEVKLASNITFKFSRPDDKSHMNCYTFYLSYTGPLTQPKEIKVDITIKEEIFFGQAEVAVLKSYDEFSDIPEGEKILVYSLQEIASEKTVALLDRARTEPRDLYDIWYLTDNDSIDLSECLDAINKKLAHRKKNLSEVKDEFGKKETRLESTWSTRLSHQMNSLPKFIGIYRTVKRKLRQAEITSK